MKAITIDFNLVAESMRDLAREHNEYYLDRNTARVISLSRDLIRSLTSDGFEERPSIPEWDARMIPVARQIILEGSKEYIRIPEAFGRPEHLWRIDYTETIKNKELKEKLTLALRGRGSVRRFKEILKNFDKEWGQWKKFYQEAWKQKICAWLEEIGLLGFEQRPLSSKKKSG